MSHHPDTVFGEFATNLQYREARARYQFALPRVTGALKPAIRAVKRLDPLGLRRWMPGWMKGVVSRLVMKAGGATSIPEMTEEDFTIHPGVEPDDEYMLAVCSG